MATVDPERRGEISYAGFCEALRLHKLRDNRGATVATQRTSAIPTVSSQSMAQVLSTGGVANAGGKGGPKERGVRRAARRKALDLATHAEINLDGGIFHRNPATVNCTNPNFTTTMVKSCGDEKYCPGTRQPPALARSSGNTLPRSCCCCFLHINRSGLNHVCVCCVCVCFLPIHSGHQVRWTYQPGSHRKKVTQDFSSTFFLRCVP